MDDTATPVGSTQFALPRLSARQQLRAGRTPRRVVQLVMGLVGYGAAVMVLVQSGLGAASWSVLSEGAARTLVISFGWATNVVAALVLLAWIPLREIPGIGTVLNVAVVGVAADATALFVPHPHVLALRIVYLAVGLLALAFFDAVYLGAHFGSGPRDGIMTGLIRRTGRPIAVVRTVIEVMVATTGWLLGGTLGVGTIVVALGMGPLVAMFLPRVAVRLPGATGEDRTR